MSDGCITPSQFGALESRVADWETILNRSHESLRGEEIKVHAALKDLTEEFKGLRQDVVNLRGAVDAAIAALKQKPRKRRAKH